MSFRIARRAISSLSIALIVSGITVFGATSPANATSVLDVELHDGQAISVWRSPSYPTCSISGDTFSSFRVYKMSYPYSTPTAKWTAPLGTDYLKLLASGDANHPWRLGRFNSVGEELRWNGSAWIGPSVSGYSSAVRWDDAGVVLALYADGYFYESFPQGYGLYVSLSTPFPMDETAETTYTPTSEFNDCVNTAAYGEVAVAKSAAIDPNNGGGGVSPVVDVVVSGAVGDKLEGQTATITGSDLKATSPFDLTMHSDPVVLKQGTTDGSGAFSETVILPTEVCGQSGVHELVLTGTDANDAAVTDSVWVELATDCTIMQIGDAALTASMPNTGVSVRNSIIVSASGVMLFLLALFVYRSRRGLRFAFVNDRVSTLMGDLDSRLANMEASSRIAAARRRLRK